VEFAEEDLLIPQWAIVVIVIGVGSLVFVVIFGVTVVGWINILKFPSLILITKPIPVAQSPEEGQKDAYTSYKRYAKRTEGQPYGWCR